MFSCGYLSSHLSISIPSWYTALLKGEPKWQDHEYKAPDKQNKPITWFTMVENFLPKRN